MNLYKLAVSARAKMSAGHIYVKHNITLSILQKGHIFNKKKILNCNHTVRVIFACLIQNRTMFFDLNSKREDISQFNSLLQKSAIYYYRKTTTSFQTENQAQGCFNYFN